MADLPAVRCGRSAFAAVAKTFGMKGGLQTFAAVARASLVCRGSGHSPGDPVGFAGFSARFYSFSLIKSSKVMIRPAIALATTVGGLASQVLPGPPRPGKFLLIAEMVT